MHALQFVQEFAAITGQDYASLRVIDRALADAGLRAKARGKRLPDVTREEALTFLLAVLANDQPTRAAESVRAVAAFRPMQGPEYTKDATVLARTIGYPLKLVWKLHLLGALTELCVRLCERKDMFAEVSVDRGGAAFVQFGAGPAILQFVGTLDSRRPKILTETRTASARLMHWIANCTRLPEKGAE
jgi:hypothetical protein